jgi:intracellular septation protein A
MTWTVFIYGIVPLVVFVLVDTFASLKWAVVAAIVFGVFDVLLSYYSTGELDPGSLVALALLCLLGWVSLRSGDAKWVKLQPVVQAVALALFVLYFQVWGQPLIERYAPLMRQATPPAWQHLYDDPVFLRKLDHAVDALVAVFLIHGALVAYAAYRMSNMAWLLIRGLGIWVLVAVSSILCMVL